jgi:hypothetical protein
MPDGAQGRVWLAGKIGDERHWRINRKAAITVDQSPARLTEKPTRAADYNPHGPTPGGLKATTTHLNTTRVAIRSFLPVSIVDLSRSWRRQHEKRPQH